MHQQKFPIRDVTFTPIYILQWSQAFNSMTGADNRMSVYKTTVVAGPYLFSLLHSHFSHTNTNTQTDRHRHRHRHRHTHTDTHTLRLHMSGLSQSYIVRNLIHILAFFLQLTSACYCGHNANTKGCVCSHAHTHTHTHTHIRECTYSMSGLSPLSHEHTNRDEVWKENNQKIN